ncbi:MAG: RHS repeat-associated core domain-containing protein [Pyrinomonadaceae bacterium]
MPAHNSFVAETTTTLADSNQVSRTSSINPNTGEIGFDQYNNQTDFYEYDFGIGAPGALLRRIHTDFVIHPDYLNGQLFSLPSQTWVSSDINGTTKASLTQFEYDNYNPDANHAGLVARSSVVGHDTTNYGTSKTNRGNVTKVTTYENAQTQTGAVSAYSQYDILGNVVKTIDAKGNASTIDYADRFGAPDDEVLSNTPPAHLNGQSTFAFPTAVTNPPAVTNQLGWTAYAQFDYFTGQPVNAEDINGVIAKTIYNDLLDRPTQSVTAVGTTFERQANIIYDDANRRIETKTDLNALNDNLLKSESFYDGLGRTFEARKYESNGDYVATKTEYDALGRPKRATNPYRPQQNETIYWTESFYDALSRVTKIKTPDNAEVLTAYSGNSVTVTDQAGKQRRSVTNALGQLIRVDEPDAIGNLGSISAPNQPTNYFYNTLGKMVRVQQGVQNRYFMYDSLGRALRVKQPEQEVNTALDTTGNADNNSWTAGFSYDNNGNVLTTTDAKGTTITNTYDALNRPLTRTYSDGTPTVTNYYDDQTAPFSKGKLTKVTSNISETTYTSFDMAGRLLSSTQRTPLDGETVANAIPRTSSYVYNLSGSLTQETYPSGRVVNHEYDASGDIARISGRPTATATEQMYATGFSYFADGKIERLKLGNGLWESAKLNSRLQATEIAMGHSVGDGSLMKLNYEYGELNTDGSVDTTKNAGNIAKQTVSFSGLAHPFVQTYKYDSLDRIKEAIEKVNGVQTWKQTFGYDIYGNRNAFYQKVGSQELAMNNLTLPTVEPTSNRFAINQGYGYDKDGNITTDPANGGRSFVFNGDNKQTEVKNSSNVTIGRYYYNGEGKRVKKVTDLETTIFVYDGLGKLVAEYSTAAPPTNPTINYTATDQLGSPRVLTDKLGNVVSRRDFLPFGEEIYANSTANRTEANRYSLTGQDTVRKRFTGYEKDIETGLDFAEARYYQNQHGRFAAVDPLLASGKSANPQTFNRYVYTMNRPLVLNDPSGLQAGTSSLGYEFSVTVRSFAPFEWFGTYANIARGDNRGFSTDPSATYRIQATSQMVARNDGISHPMSITRASEATTSETNIGGLISWTAQSECYIQDPNGNYAPDGLLGGTDLISYQMSGNDDAIPGSSNINLHPNIWFNFDESQGNGVVDMTVTTSVSGDQFPAAEAFVTDTSGNSVMLGTFAPLSSNGPVFGLMTDQRLPMIDSRTTVRVNNGVFEGVVENGNVVPLDEYNGRFTQQPAVRPSP